MAIETLKSSAGPILNRDRGIELRPCVPTLLIVYHLAKKSVSFRQNVTVKIILNRPTGKFSK